jgi:hypothetical protein
MTVVMAMRDLTPRKSAEGSMRRIYLAAVFLTAISLVPATASAGTFSGSLTQVFSGNVPDSTSPYLTFTFYDNVGTADCGAACGANQVKLVLTASLEDGDEFVTEWDFNTLLSITSIVNTSITGATAPSISIGSNSFQADGDGLYDIMFSFVSGPPSGRFNGTDTATFIITGTGITAQTFNTVSAPAGGAGGPFTSAAHIQGISGGCSGWVSTSGPDTNGNDGACGSVPDGGATLTLLGLALAGIGAVRRYIA